MKRIGIFIFLLLVCVAYAGSERPKAYLRFHVQVLDASESNQAIPIQLMNPQQQIWVKKYAELTEDNISDIEIIEGGKVLITFNQGGQVKLEETTTSNMNHILVVIFNNGQNARVVYAPIIDTVLRDGKFLLPEGMSAQEVNSLKEVLKLKQRD